MAANHPRVHAPLWVSLLVVASAHALPAHPDVLLEPEAGNFGLRLRAVRRPDGSSHMTHTGAHTTHTATHTGAHTTHTIGHDAHHHGVRVVMPAAPDSLPAESAPQPESKFGDRTRPVNVKGQAPTNKIGAWQAHPDVKVVLPPGLDESIVPADGEDGVRAELDAAEDSKPEAIPTNEEEKQVTEEKKDTRDKPGEDDGTRQKLPDTLVVLPPGWDEPGFKPAGNDDAVRAEGNEDDDDTRNKESNTFVQLPPVDGEPGLQPPEEEGAREEEEEEKKEDETKQNLPDTSVVLPPGWDEPGFRPAENNDGVRTEGNKDDDDTRNKEPNTSVQLPPGYEELGDRPAGDEEGVREEENDKEDNTRQKLPDTSVVLPPGWDEPGFQPPGNEDALRDEASQDNSNTPELTDSSPGETPNPVKGESSSSTSSDDVSPSKDWTNKDDTKKTRNPAVSSTQTVKNNQPSPSNAGMPVSANTNDEKDQKKNPQESKESANPSEVEPVDKPQDALPDSAQSVKKSGSAAATPDDAVRLQVPPEFYLTRKNHAARPHVRPTPPPSDHPDFIAENPLFEWTFPCSSQEKSCLEEDRVLYDGDRKCYQLWRSGPCERGQWLVIDKGEALNGSGHFRAVCTNMSRCPERQVFMASDRQCHPFAQIIREICPKHEGLQLSYNVFGEGECKCDNCPHPQLPTNTFGEGRCAFPPSFYRAGAHVGLEVAWRAAMAEAAADVAAKTARTRATALTT